MTDCCTTFVQTGIRQRSLRKHCRVGRATELVFVVATGLMLSIGGSAMAQDLDWDAGNTGDVATAPATGGNGNWNTDAGNAVWTDGAANVAYVQNSDVTFGGPGTYEVTLDTAGTISADRITFTGDDVLISGVAGALLEINGAGDIRLQGAATTAEISATISSDVRFFSVGELELSGSVQGGVTQTAANAGSLLVISGTVDGRLVNNDAGSSSVSGTVGSLNVDEGLVTIQSGGTVTGTTTIDGVDATDTGTVNVLTGGNLGAGDGMMVAPSTVTINNFGILDVDGGDVGNVTLNAGGTAELGGGTLESFTQDAGFTGTTTLDGSTVTGTTEIDGGSFVFNSGTLGDVENAGSFEITADQTVGGNFTNDGTLDASGVAGGTNVTLTTSGFVNSGDIDTNGADTVTINSVDGMGGDGDITLNLGSTFDSVAPTLGGNVILDGNIISNVDLTISSDYELLGDLRNNATFNVDAELDAAGNDITNSAATGAGVFNVNGTGSIVNGGDITNEAGGTFAIDEGASVAATTLTNSGSGSQLTVEGGLTGNLVNADGATTTINNDEIANNTSGLVTGTISITGGSVTLNGATTGITQEVGVVTVGGATANTASGTFTVNDGNVTTINNNGLTNTGMGDATEVTINDGIVNNFFNNSGETLITGGQVSGPASISGGTVTVDATGGDMALELASTTTVTGGALVLTDGDIGAVINSGPTNTGMGDATEVTITDGTVASLTNNSGEAVIDGGAVGAVIVNAGAVDLNGGSVTSVDVNDDGMGARGTLNVGGDATVDTGVTNGGDFNINTGTLTVTAGNFDNEAGGILTIADGAELDTNTSDLVNAGTVNIGGVGGAGAELTADGIDNNDGGIINVNTDSTLTGTGNTTDNSGTVNVAGGGSLIEVTGNYNNETSGIVNFDGPTDMTFDVQGAMGIITNEGTINFNDASTTVNSTGGAIQNNVDGQIVIDNGATMNAAGDTLVNDATGAVGAGATVTVEGTMTIDTVTNQNGGTIVVNDDAGATTTGVISGVVENTATLDINGGQVGTIDNNVAGMDRGDADLDGIVTVDNGITNAGDLDINTGNTTVTAGGTTNEDGGILTVADAGVLTSDVGNEVGAQLDVEGDVDGTVTNDGGAVNLTAGSVGSLGNNNVGMTRGTVTSTGVSAVDATVTNEGDFNVNSGNLTVTNSTFTNEADGITTVADGATLTSDVGNEVDAQLDVEGDVDGTVTNDGGTVNLTAGSVGGLDNNNVGMTRGSVASTGVSLVDNPVTNEGDLDIDSGTLSVQDGMGGRGTTTNESGGILTIDAMAELDSDVDNESGSLLQVDGTLDGDLDNQANPNATVISSTGDVTGTLDNAGIVALQGGTVGTLNNNTGDVEVTGGGTVDNGVTNNADSFTVNSGTLIVTAGGFDNQSSGVLNFDTAAASGLDVQGTGLLTNAGAINFNAGTTTLNAAGGPIENNAGGTINVDNGATVDAGGDTLVNAGAGAIVTVEGDLTIDTITNQTGAQLLVNNDGGGTTSGVVTGDVNVEGGTVVVDGTADGTLEIDGTVTVGGTMPESAGGTFTLTDGDVGPLVNNAITDGTADITITDGAVASLDNNSGDSEINGGEVATLTSGGGTTTVTDGVVTGTTTINDGEVVVDETTASPMVVELQGDVTVETDGTLTVTDGQVDDIINNGGTVALTTGAAASLDNNNAAAMDRGDVDTDGDFTIAGNVTNEGDLDVNSGTLTVTSDSTTNESSGVLTIADMATLDSNTVNEAGGQLNVSGTLDGTLDNQSNGMTSAVIEDTGDVTGVVTNTGILDVNGGDLGGLLNNAGGVADFDGDSIVANGITNAETLNINVGTVTVQDGMGMTGLTTNNTTGTLTIAGPATLASNVSNSGGVVELVGEIDGSVLSNTGTINVSGAGANITENLNTSGELNLEGSGTVLGVGGDAALNGNVTIDATGGTVGSIAVFGNSSGSASLTLDNFVGAAGDLDNAVLLTYGGTNTLSFGALIGFPVGGGLDFVAEDDLAGSIVLSAITSNSVSSVAATVGLTQSLVNTVVNRPTSPFVADLAAGAEEKPCGAGGWVRATGGTANASGNFTDVEANATGTAPVSLNYSGLQFGGDFACFGGHYNGWDLAFGGIAGFNDASSSSNTFGIGGALENVIDSDIFQKYVGVYATAARGRFFADLQFRFEDTDYETSNVLISGTGLSDFTDSEYSNTGQTVSGALGYSWQGAEGSGLTFVSSAGFSFSNNETDDVVLGTNGTLNFEDGKSQVGFLSASVAKTTILPDELSLISYFGTATVYNDFADDRTAFFTPTGGTARELALENLGAYGEVSLGVNYLKLLSPGDAGNARQLNASVRVDARFNGDLESYGITGQLRLQF